MNNHEIMLKLGVIFTEKELGRLTIQSEETIVVTADVHGMKCAEAKRFINNLLNILCEAIKVVIIHGYNHGTAIKEMLRNNFYNSRIKRMYGIPYNMGVTVMELC